MLWYVRITFAIALLGMSGETLARVPLIDELRSRLAKSDVAAVNAYLSANWETKMAQLGRLVQRCDQDALELSVDLLSTTNLEALQGHVYSLEVAMGKCPEKLIPMVPNAQIKSLCAVDAYSETHPSARLVDEIDKRVKQIGKTKQLAASENGQACIDAYQAARQRLQ